MNNVFKYIPVLIAVAEILKPISDDFTAAMAEGKSTDPVTLKMQKILADADDAMEKLIKAL